MAIDLVRVEINTYFLINTYISCNVLVTVYEQSFKFGHHRTYTSAGVPFFLSEISFTNIHDSQDSKGRGRLSLKLLFTISTHFTDT